MARGRKSPVGTETAINGYIYVRLEDGRWEAKHRLVAEEKLGRRLTAREYIRFKDGDRNNLDPDNLEIKLINRYSLIKRREELVKKIASLQEELVELETFI